MAQPQRQFPITRRQFVPMLIGSLTLARQVGEVKAQPAPRAVSRGGEIRIPAVATGEERTAQPDLWVLDVYLKPMRLLPIELTDKKTGEKKLEHVWYIVYRAAHRKMAPREGDAKTPENVVDAPVSPPLFVPEFTLVVTDAETPVSHADVVVPEAVPIINKREKGNYKTSVSIVGPIPEAADPGKEGETALWGVAMWRGIDPNADRYTVYMSGFSNGFQKADGPDGNPVVQTKTLMQKYWRIGERFEQNEAEIQVDGDPKWIYR